MPWLADSDVGAAYGFAQSIAGSRTEAELRHRAFEALAELVPADVLTWDRVELATGAVDREATPVGAEPAPLLVGEAVAEIRPDALDRLGLTARESEVLRAAALFRGEAELAWELFLSLHAVRERLARPETKLGVHTAGDAVAQALRESL